MPASPQRVVVGEPEQRQRLAQLVVGVPAGGDADPVVARCATVTRLSRLTTPYWRASTERTSWNSRSMSSVYGREQPPARVRARTGLPSNSIVGTTGTHAIGVDVDGAGAVGDRRDELEADPDAAGPRQRDGVAAEVERLLHVAGEEDRHVQVDQRGVARAGQRRRLRRRVVADERDHAAVAGGAGEHGVADGVAGAVEARGLAVPDADARRRSACRRRESASWLPITDVAASSSLRPGRTTIGRSGTVARRRPSLLLERADRRALVARTRTPPCCRPWRRSMRSWSTGRRASACSPDRNTRPSSRRKRSASW